MREEERICIQTGLPCGYPCWHNCPSQYQYQEKTEKSNKSTEKMKWYEKLLFYSALTVAVIATSLFIPSFKRHLRARSEVKRKLRYFNPVITEGFWGKKITWVGREKPLTDDELKNLL